MKRRFRYIAVRLAGPFAVVAACVTAVAWLTQSLRFIDLIVNHGLPMGCDVCYTNHAAADQNSADNLLLLLAAAGCNYFMGVPGADDIMLNYQSTSFHDALGVRRLFQLTPAPEFLAWLEQTGIFHNRQPAEADSPLRQQLVRRVQTIEGSLGV